jgi:hypothetical protein
MAWVVIPVSRALSKAPLEDEEISEEEKQTVARSRKWFENNQGTPFEDVVAKLGFTLDQIRNAKEPA